jgi:hypothetical protein
MAISHMEFSKLACSSSWYLEKTSTMLVSTGTVVKNYVRTQDNMLHAKQDQNATA